jgi:hypothetical protein
LPYTGAIEVGETLTVKARTLAGGVWSPLTETTLVVGTGWQGIVISEFNYHPHAPTAAELALVPGAVDDDFEFIEIMNTHPTQSINLLNMSLANGLSFTFDTAILAPGQRAVVVEDIDSFQARYGTSILVLGQWSGRLSNSGETIELRDALGGIIMAISYLDENPWSEAPDGDGASLELIDPMNTPLEELGKWYRWRASTEFGGTPGTAGSGPIGVVINEVRSHATSPEVDAIELHNTTNQAIDISGWYLSDAGGNPLKFPIPAGTILAPGAYIAFDEDDFNPSVPAPGQIPFALSAWNGDDVFLVIPDGMGGVASFVDSVHFGATFNGQSLGRVGPHGRLAPLGESSFGAANGNPLVGPVVVTEVGYGLNSPSPSALAIDGTLTPANLQFIEIHNSSSSPINMANYQLAGDVAFSLSGVGTLPGGATVVVVPFSPAINPTKASAFRAHYGIDSSVALVGPFAGSLSELGARVSLEAPDAPPPSAPSFIPRVLVDEVLYDNLAPWPAAGAGLGVSLQRTAPTAFGNDGLVWQALTPTPGSVDFSGSVPGDFSGDGVVTLDDLQKLIDAVQWGLTSTYYDLNGDQAINAADIAYLVNDIVAPIAGDYNWDNVVDASDYVAWKEAYGSPLRLNADANGDGVVDAADYTIWRNNLGNVGGGGLLAAGMTQPESTPLPTSPSSESIIVSVDQAPPPETGGDRGTRWMFVPATRESFVRDAALTGSSTEDANTAAISAAREALLLSLEVDDRDALGQPSDAIQWDWTGDDDEPQESEIAALDAGFANWAI